LLVPDIVEVIPGGLQREGMTLKALMKPSTVEWERQRVLMKPAAED
jgi:hypothetical protein